MTVPQEVAQALPPFNTALIVISGVFLTAGYISIRRGHRRLHPWCMVTATVFAALFLVVYVTRAALLPGKHFTGQGAAYGVYLGILVPHMIAAIAVGPLALVTIARAAKGNFAKHRRLARVTFPTWVFAAATGWVIYVMLYLIDWGV